MSRIAVLLSIIVVGALVALMLWPNLACIGSGTANNNGSNGGVGGSASAARPSDASRHFPLDTLATANLTINNSTIRAWLAKTQDQHTEGLMHVTEQEIADDQGMLFVFDDEALRFFWMRNTITSLDIAYARMDGTIVKTHTMPPLTLNTFPSVEPAMFALELKAGTLTRLGIKEGDRIIIPDDVFKR